MSTRYLFSLLSPFLVLLFTLQSRVANSESLSYSVLKDNKQIGHIHIDRTVKNDITEYFFESNVKLTFIFSVEVYDRMRVTFKSNVMQQALLYRTLNGKVKVDNKSLWNGSMYNMTNTDDENIPIRHPIRMTTANLYYYEPSNIPYVFSEKFQKMIAIKYVGNRRYLLNLPNGNKTYYSYTNGICSMVEAETDWATLKFVLNK